MDIVSSTLQVCEVPTEMCAELKKVVSTWREKALEKKGKCTILKKEATIFEESIFVLTNIKILLGPTLRAKVLLCYDSKFSPEAIGVYSQSVAKIELLWLATNPKNIKHELNDLTQRVSGAAALIIRHLASISLASRSFVEVRSLSGAVSFYEKCGFEEVEDDDGKSMLTLRVETIKDRLLAA